MAGFYSSYLQSYRFAAADRTTGSEGQKAIACVMVGALIAAIIGPQLVIWTRDTLPGTAFSGSFITESPQNERVRQSPRWQQRAREDHSISVRSSDAASIQPASMKQDTTDLGIPVGSEKHGNALGGRRGRS